MRREKAAVDEFRLHRRPKDWATLRGDRGLRLNPAKPPSSRRVE